jgi:hypothetical protein
MGRRAGDEGFLGRQVGGEGRIPQQIEQQRTGLGDGARAEGEHHVAWRNRGGKGVCGIRGVAGGEGTVRQEADQVGGGDAEVVGFPRRVDIEDQQAVGV